MAQADSPKLYEERDLKITASQVCKRQELPLP